MKPNLGGIFYQSVFLPTTSKRNKLASQLFHSNNKWESVLQIRNSPNYTESVSCDKPYVSKKNSPAVSFLLTSDYIYIYIYMYI